MVALTDDRAESAAESRTRWALKTLGFRMPEPQVEILDERGEFVARVDFLYADIKLVIEVDGRLKYDTPQALWDEKLREDRLRELGYTIVRLTWADLDDPQVVQNKVLRGATRAAA
jgi:very-short-patch-repair endonuclease